MGRGTFAIIIGLIVAAVAGSFIGGRLSAQEILAVLALFMLWAFGVSLFRGFVRLRRRMKPTRRRPGE
ncbi:MAG TPA: hypothetical protein VLT15_13930 [Acidimicrobiia bacterium]|nr:hypothetical protein [Acidimicrobiia bacterium]